jgi:D-3-phosphoglycerate dehydrogenase
VSSDRHLAERSDPDKRLDPGLPGLHTPPVPRAHALLLESIHPFANEAFERADVAIRRVKGALEGDDLVAALHDIPGTEPVLLGIRSKSRVKAAVFDAVPRLMAVGAFCIGTDQIELEAARERGVAVFNAPFSNTRSVAELVLAEIVMLSRQVFQRSWAAHEGEWLKSADGAHEVRGKTLGIVGYGHIGTQLSVLAEAMGMRVVYYDIVSKLPLGNARSLDSLDDLLAKADYVTLHVPDTELTRGMIGAKQLAAMKPGACLINASRGKVVDIAALKLALESGHVSGAAIDVFPHEPAAAGERFSSPLQGLKQVILTPHIGGSTEEAQANIGREVSDVLAAFLTTGRTTTSLTIPALDAAELRGGCRIVNVHRDVPGVLSAVNQVIAGVKVNISGQHLVTQGGVGLLLVDVAVHPADPRIEELARGIADLETSLRTRLIG